MNTFSDSVGTALQLILSGDAGLWAIVIRSLAVSGTACLLACSLGLLLGAWLAVARFPGRSVVLTLLNTSLAIPSVVVGLVIYLLLSRTGPLGFLGWLFSFQAMVLAQAILVLPLVTALTRQVVEDADRDHGTARLAGRRPGPAQPAHGLGRALRLAHRADHRLWPGGVGSGRGDDRGRQHRRLHPRHDHRHRARNQQGRPAAGARAGHRAAGRGAAAQQRGGAAAPLARAPGRRRPADGHHMRIERPTEGSAAGASVRHATVLALQGVSVSLGPAAQVEALRGITLA